MKVMMPLLFIIMIVLIIVGISLPGSSAGLKLFLYPDFSKLTGKGVLDALGLAFFSSLSVWGSTLHTARICLITKALPTPVCGW